jgi:AAA+ superfamily predicted ATPase
VLRVENDSEERSRTIRAKASSSIILAKGPAGTGKTLTAEVYAEEIKRPLYEVQSGQLGTDPEELEANLQEILNRSVRLRMPLLINEADVFVQTRGRDLKQNAIVSVFLRLLEYHNGLIFLTTNRADDVDDAILSRCLAEILYGVPKTYERYRLWKIMLAEFNVEMSEEDICKAVLYFPEVSGRDIQNLVRLVNRVSTALNQPFDLKALHGNASFKGIKVKERSEVSKEIEELGPLWMKKIQTNKI